MGREIRMVPPNWEHPKNEYGNYIPMYDRTFNEVLEEYYQNYIAWRNKTHEDYDESTSFGDYFGSIDPDGYRPEFKEEPTWYQVYETVSEGAPVTPPFETKEELVEYLVEKGTFWDQQRVRDGRQSSVGWNRKSAEQFAKDGWVMSGIVSNGIIRKPGDQDFYNIK